MCPTRIRAPTTSRASPRRNSPRSARHRPARFRASGDRLRAGQMAGRVEVAQALSRELPQLGGFHEDCTVAIGKKLVALLGRNRCASAATGIRAAACPSTSSGRPATARGCLGARPGRRDLSRAGGRSATASAMAAACRGSRARCAPASPASRCASRRIPTAHRRSALMTTPSAGVVPPSPAGRMPSGCVVRRHFADIGREEREVAGARHRVVHERAGEQLAGAGS